MNVRDKIHVRNVNPLEWSGCLIEFDFWMKTTRDKAVDSDN